MLLFIAGIMFSAGILRKYWLIKYKVRFIFVILFLCFICVVVALGSCNPEAAGSSTVKGIQCKTIGKSFMRVHSLW